MIRTVVSDLGNVLLRFDHMVACRRLAEQCRLSPEEIYGSMLGSGLVGEYERGRISSLEFARMSMERIGADLDMRVMRDIWSDIFHPVEGMEELIRFLKENYTLILMSNTNEWHFEHCQEKFPVVGLFDHYVLSYRVGCQKPDPAIYQKALALAKASPEETLYVDDIDAYVEVAKTLGWKGICFLDTAQLIREMKAEGIRCP